MIENYSDQQLAEAADEHAGRLIIFGRVLERGEDLGWVYGWDLGKLHALALEINRRRDLDAEHAETLYDSDGNPVKTTVWGIRSTELSVRNEARLEAFADVVEALGLDKATELVQVISGGDEALASDLRRAYEVREESAPKTARPDWDPRAAFQARLVQKAEAELKRMADTSLPPFEIHPRDDGSGFDVTDGLASFWALTREEAETVAAAANENRTQR